MFSANKKIMGTNIEILIPKEEDFDEEKAEMATQRVFVEFERLEQIFSRFQENSELSMLNKKRSQKVSDELRNVLEFAIQMAKETKGIFNPLINLSAIGYSRDF